MCTFSERAEKLHFTELQANPSSNANVSSMTVQSKEKTCTTNQLNSNSTIAFRLTRLNIQFNYISAIVIKEKVYCSVTCSIIGIFKAMDCSFNTQTMFEVL